MIEIRLGKRYAQGVMDLAIEKGQLEEVHTDFELIDSVCYQNRDFVGMLKSPLIHGDKKQEIINAIFGGKFRSEITKKFIEIIIKKGREPYLRDISIVLLDLYDREKNITRGTLTSAAPLSESQRKLILDQVEKDLGTKFVLEEKVDPELIGGFVLRIGDRLYDGSIASSIRQLKQEFEKNPYIELV